VFSKRAVVATGGAEVAWQVVAEVAFVTGQMGLALLGRRRSMPAPG
jgi:hypothetical protein